MSKKDRGKYEKAIKLIKPLFEELVEAGEDLMEACDGQGAIVIDAKMKSKKIAADVPETEEPMPLLEPAIVVGIKDADDMREAYVGFQSFFNGLLEAIRELDEEGEIPEDYEIPWPDVSEDFRHGDPDLHSAQRTGSGRSDCAECGSYRRSGSCDRLGRAQRSLAQVDCPETGRCVGRREEASCGGCHVQLGGYGRRPDALAPTGGSAKRRRRTLAARTATRRSRRLSPRSTRFWRCSRRSAFARWNATSKRERL